MKLIAQPLHPTLLVALWNACWPPGTLVQANARPYGVAKTQAQAMVFGDKAVVLVNGHLTPTSSVVPPHQWN